MSVARTSWFARNNSWVIPATMLSLLLVIIIVVRLLR